MGAFYRSNARPNERWDASIAQTWCTVSDKPVPDTIKVADGHHSSICRPLQLKSLQLFTFQTLERILHIFDDLIAVLRAQRIFDRRLDEAAHMADVVAVAGKVACVDVLALMDQPGDGIGQLDLAAGADDA